MAPRRAKAPIVGTGKVTDTQVAFMVECYLRDSHFNKTLEEFRSEASRILLPMKTVQPKGARSLGEVLNDYVELKEEQLSFASERARVQNLFQGLQEILAAYQSGSVSGSHSASPLLAPQQQLGHLPPPPPAMACCPPMPVFNAQQQQQQQQVAAADTSSLCRKRPSYADQVSVPAASDHGAPLSISSPDPVKKPRRNSMASSEGMADASGPAATLHPHSNSVQPSTPPAMNSTSKSQQHADTTGCSSPSQRASPMTSAMAAEQHQSFVSPSRNATTAMNDPHTPSSSSSSDMPASYRASSDGHSDDRHSALLPSSNSVVSNPSTRCHPATRSLSRSPSFAEPSMQSRAHPVSRINPNPQACLSNVALPRRSKRCSQANSTITPAKAKLPGNKSGSSSSNTNSKCRLLDFSSAASDQATPIPADSHIDDRLSGDAASDPHHHHHRPQVELEQAPLPPASSSSSLQPASIALPEAELQDMSIIADGAFFDDFFNLELDTTLICELEELSPTSLGDDGSASLSSGNTMVVPCNPPSVLAEKDMNCQDPKDSALRSPSKLRKSSQTGTDGSQLCGQENDPTLAAIAIP